MEEILNEILGKLEKITKDMDEVKETLSTLATHEEVGRVAETLQLIATGEVAATRANLEDKIDARDVLNKSLIDGLEDRLTKELREVFKEVREGFKETREGFGQLSQGIEILSSNQKHIADVLNVFIDRFERQDDLMNLFDQRLKEQEWTTRQLRKAISKLGGDAS